MKKLIEKIKSLDKKDFTKIYIATLAMIIVLDCDEYLYSFFQSIHLPLPHTILTFIWLPILILLVFYRLEDNKKKVLIAAVIIAAVYGIYFVLHHLSAHNLVPQLKLPENYYYNLYQEIIYYATMILPLIFIYVAYKIDFEMEDFEKMIIIISALIAIPILVTNIFTCSPSTYEGWTKANFLTWFTGIYDTYTPREIATSFFFSEGNTTGMVMFMTYPILLNITRKKNCNYKYVLLLIVQGIAMYCLSTRVATYGVVLMISAYLVIYIISLIFKKVKFSAKLVIIYVLLLGMFLLILPKSPAYVNQQINHQNDMYIFENEEMRREIGNSLEEIDLDPDSEEYKNYWSFIFKQYSFFLPIPKEYFMDFYYYRFDPKFWVDIIFDYDFYDRDSGRDIENIFTQYKWQRLTDKQKLFGMSFSIPMEGGIVIEQDFVSQYYTHGIIGDFLLCSPWIIGLVVVVVLAIKNFKKIIGPDILTIGLSFVGGLGTAYYSGHLLAEIFGSILLATLLAMLLRMLIKNNS